MPPRRAQLNAQLSADHGLTLSDYEVLLRLARAPDRRMRRVDLAEQVLLTRVRASRACSTASSGGLVERGSCDSDRRVVYAVLTDAGLAKLREAAESHVAQVEALFRRAFDDGRAREPSRDLARRGSTARADDCAPRA